MKGSKYGAWPDVLQPLENEIIITKRYASCFFGTHLSSTLAAMQIDTLLICGVSTSGCVRATATGMYLFYSYSSSSWSLSSISNR